MCDFFDKRGYPASVVQAGHDRAQQIDRQSALQTSQKANTVESRFLKPPGETQIGSRNRG